MNHWNKFLAPFLLWATFALPHSVFSQVVEPTVADSFFVPEHPDTIYVGTYFVWMYDMNLTDGSYSAKAWIWFRFKNPALSPEVHAAIYNAKEYRFENVIRRKHQGWHWVQMNCTALVRQKYLLTHFPFDKQTFRFRLGYEGADTHSVVFVRDTISNSVYDPFNHPEGWRMIGFDTEVENRTYQTDFGTPIPNGNDHTISMFMARIRLARHGWSLFFKLFAGMYAAFLIAWLSLFINPGAVDPRFGLSVGGLFAAVGNKYIVDSILPEMASDNLVDTLHAFTFLAVILCLAISVISLFYHERCKIKLYKRIDRVASLAILAGYTLVNIILVMYAVYAAPPQFWATGM